MNLLRQLRARAAELWQRLSARQRRLLRVAGYSAFGLITFLMAFSASIPRERLRDRLERELSQDPGPTAPAGLGMDVTIGELGLSFFPPGAALRDVTLKSRSHAGVAAGGAGGAEEKPTRSFIDAIEVRPALLGLLVGRRGGRLELRGFRGEVTIEGGVRPLAQKGDGKAPEARLLEGDVRVDAAGVALALVPGLAKAVPLPLSGILDLKGELKGALDPRTMNPQAQSLAGEISLSVAGCVLGNGKAMLKIPGDPFLSQGLTFPRVELGRVNGKIRIDKGRVNFEGLRAKSADAEAALDGYIDLRDPLQFSELHLYLRLKPSAALAGREPKIQMLESALMMGKRPDGFLGLSIQGTGVMPQARPSKDPPPGVTARTIAWASEAGTPSGESLGAVRAEAPAPGGLPIIPRYVPPAPAAAPPPAPAAAPPPPSSFAPPPPAPVINNDNSAPTPTEAPRPPEPALRTASELPPPPPPPAAPPSPLPPGSEEPTPPSNLPTNMRGE